jgi:hypothetical protein
MPGAQPGAGALQLLAGGLALPIGFEGEFELALGANAGEAKIMRCGHEISPEFEGDREWPDHTHLNS